MDKEIDEIGETYYKAENVYMKKNFYFHIKISKLPDGKGKAALYLYEFVGDFLPEQFIVSHIADFIDEFDENFKIKVRKAFNLVDVDVPNNDFETPSLAILMQRMIDEEIRSGALYDMACQISLMRLLKMLENSGEKGAQIVVYYKQMLAQVQGSINKQKYPNIANKILLDRAINTFGGFEKNDITKDQYGQVIGEFNSSADEIESSKTNTTVEGGSPTKQEDNKPASKKSSGGGGNKSATKKSATKKPAAKKPAGKKPVKKAGEKEKKKRVAVTWEEYQKAINAGKPDPKAQSGQGSTARPAQAKTPQTTTPATKIKPDARTTPTPKTKPENATHSTTNPTTKTEEMPPAPTEENLLDELSLEEGGGLNGGKARPVEVEQGATENGRQVQTTTAQEPRTQGVGSNISGNQQASANGQTPTSNEDDLEMGI